LLRLALAKPTRALARRIAIDLSRTPQDATSAIPGVLCAFASARMLLLVRAAYESWDARKSYMDAHTTIALVHAFTRGSRSAKNTEFAHTVLNDYLEMSGKRSTAVEASLTALHAYGLIGQPDKGKKKDESEVDAPDPAAHHVDVLVRTLGRSGALERLQSLTTRYPLLAHRLAQVGRAHGLNLPTAGVTIASACAARHWGSLSVASSIPLAADEVAFLRVLMSARKGRRGPTLNRFKTAVEQFPDSPMAIPTFSAVLQRFVALRAWDEGLQVISGALCAETVEPASVFFSAIQREASGVVAENAARAAREAGDAAARAEESAGKVQIYIDNLAGEDKASGLAHEALVAAQAAGAAAESRDAAREAWIARGGDVKARVAAVEGMGQTLLETMAEGVDAAVAVDSSA